MNNVLVTGGGGFVGSVIVRQLLESGCRVIIVGRNRYPFLERHGAVCRVGDIADGPFMHAVCKGVDTVFHTAAKAGIWGSWTDYRRTNIDGTAHVVSACLKNGVRQLIYTSTPSVVFNCRDIINGDESLPYAEKFLCHYQRSKTIAEKLVLDNNTEQLRTCAIRAHLIWGPNDPHLIPRLIVRGRAGALKIIGTGDNRVDITYVDNVAHAHLLAAQSLEKNGKASGRAYFIGQERPVRLWQWINELYRALGIEEIKTRVPFFAAYMIGAMLEGYYTLLSLHREPRMTRFLAEQLARSHFFRHDRAVHDLAYEPLINLQEGRDRLVAWLKEQL